MDTTRVGLRRESFSCCICLDLLEDPVTLHCGHNYCKTCLEGHWQDKNIYECPQCRWSFRERPVLQKNTVLAELVEELKKTGAAEDLCSAGPEDVACDVCTGRKMKALKSCLVCLVSYCNLHLQTHLEAPAYRRHKLVQPSKHLQEIICSEHEEEKKMFCRTDQQVICHLCAVDQHKDHVMVSAAAERREREKDVDQRRGRIQKKIQNREKEVELLQQEQENIRVSADEAVKTCQEALNQMIQVLQRTMSDVEQQIRSQQETEAALVRRLEEHLEQEISELKKKDAELQQLSLTDSHIIFLRNLTSPSEVSEDTTSPSEVSEDTTSPSEVSEDTTSPSGVSEDTTSPSEVSEDTTSPSEVSEDTTSPSEVSEDTTSSTTLEQTRRRFEEVSAAVSACRDQVLDLLRDMWTNISLIHPEREQFLRYSQNITLDPNTATSWLMLSEGNKKVRNMREHQSRPPHPDRFIRHPQALSRESLTGRCYFEVKIEGHFLAVAVSYKNISRSGEESKFGYNDKSWCLYCSFSGCSFKHNNIKTKVSRVRPSTVGVYLDHSAGLLCFYSVSETMTLLHRVQTSFTEPLHAGVSVWWSCEFV